MIRRLLLLVSLALALGGTPFASAAGSDWAAKPRDEWPQIALVNEIEYVDKHHPIAGCGFLLDTGSDTLAVTAKHVLKYFKSETMQSISFGSTLETWKMYPKGNPDDFVIIDRLLNEDSEESLDDIPSPRDWLLFTIREKSPQIQPLRLRQTPLVKGEPIYIVGWRYSDKNCRQRIYAGNFERLDESCVLVSTEELSDNTMPGLSGAPVIDAQGDVIGLMSRKAGKLERLAPIDYPRRLLEERSK